MTAKRERVRGQGYAKHRRNLDGGARYVQKKLRRNAKTEIKIQTIEEGQVVKTQRCTVQDIGRAAQLKAKLLDDQTDDRVAIEPQDDGTTEVVTYDPPHVSDGSDGRRVCFVLSHV